MLSVKEQRRPQVENHSYHEVENNWRIQHVLVKFHPEKSIKMLSNKTYISIENIRNEDEFSSWPRWCRCVLTELPLWPLERNGQMWTHSFSRQTRGGWGCPRLWDEDEMRCAIIPLLLWGAAKGNTNSFQCHIWIEKLEIRVREDSDYSYKLWRSFECRALQQNSTEARTRETACVGTWVWIPGTNINIQHVMHAYNSRVGGWRQVYAGAYNPRVGGWRQPDPGRSLCDSGRAGQSQWETLSRE